MEFEGKRGRGGARLVSQSAPALTLYGLQPVHFWHGRVLWLAIGLGLSGFLLVLWNVSNVGVITSSVVVISHERPGQWEAIYTKGPLDIDRTSRTLED